MIKERYELAAERIAEIRSETIGIKEFDSFFKRTAKFVVMLTEMYEKIEEGYLENASLKQLQEDNYLLYVDILPENYEKSYGNPSFAVRCLGEEYGRLLSFLYVELRSMIPCVFEQLREEMLIRMELFLEIYQSFSCAAEETKTLPAYESIREIIYWWVSDYLEMEVEQRILEQLNDKKDFAAKIIMEKDLSNTRYLYYYGEYVSESVLLTAKHIGSLPEEKIKLMADTYTEGYRIGFVNAKKDLSKKRTVNIRYCLGFEKMIRQAIENFEQMGLKPTIYRAASSTFHKRGNLKIGYYGAIANKQYEYDHREGEALYYDKKYISRRLNVLKNTYEKYKELAEKHAGPACVEIFGEVPFSPESKTECPRLNEKQMKYRVEYQSQAGQITNQYIKGEERSFTIISFPTPEIGDQFTQIFDEVVKINTLDYKKYQKIQQEIIQNLDLCECVKIEGEDGNQTDLTVNLYSLKNEGKESKFENCVADVNIPVGEVFTSPVLKGTNGVLHVTKVFLNELEYRNLTITIKDGMIEKYSCDNFEGEEENLSYIRENILFHHKTLPMGEFAIGTNTTAYVVAKRYHVEDRFPILIAEKMGPHFAFGDTCYSHEEEVKVFNPDGKEIVARDNEISLLRKTDLKKAYFNCHTDITIPYNELKALYGVTKEGKKIMLIEHGRFVLPGCEALNEVFDEK